MQHGRRPAGPPARRRGGGQATCCSSVTNASRQSADGAGADELFGGLLSPGSDWRACPEPLHQSAIYYKHFRRYAPSRHTSWRLRDYVTQRKLYKQSAARHAGVPKNPSVTSVQQRQQHGGQGIANFIVDPLAMAWQPDAVAAPARSSTRSSPTASSRLHSTDDFWPLLRRPFPGANATWVLPPDFPVADMSRLGVGSNQSYGNLLDGKKIANDPAKATPQSVPPYVRYLHLAHDLRRSDQLFCNDDQLMLAKVNWLLVQNGFRGTCRRCTAWPRFKASSRLFPAKESVAHLLGRYLFHRPTPSGA
ncbi:hypothetical protein ZWY2020_046450 [Hordeum vulgare]|nr:hypothetical protein ZWY2020_046450 [Hordeum vulgare]